MVRFRRAKSKMKKWNYEARERELNFRFSIYSRREDVSDFLWRFRSLSQSTPNIKHNYREI